tara:strand:+ start:1569 stop:1943 length:375 start_codon:yes stop_codon:yes gene_type:complete
LGERFPCTEEAAGSSPVNSTMDCELCTLERKTNIFIENDFFIIMDCDSCFVPMAAWKEHTMKIPESDEYVMKALLLEAGETRFGKNKFYIDTVQSRVLDHLHWHARKYEVRPTWVQERGGIDEG